MDAVFVAPAAASGKRISNTLALYFDLERETTLPAYFSSIQILFASVVTMLVAKAEAQEARRYGWFVLAVGMFLMSVDEAIELHGRLSMLRKYGLDTELPFLRWLWVIPGLGIVTASGLVLLPFLRRMPRSTSVRLVFSGAVFVTGAIGFEMLGAWISAGDRFDTFAYRLCVTCEEGCEMLGIALYIRTTLRYAEDQFGRFSVSWDSSASR